MNNWLRVPAGPPIDPGNTEVRYVGIIIVFMPTTIPNMILEKTWIPKFKLKIPINAAAIVK